MVYTASKQEYSSFCAELKPYNYTITYAPTRIAYKIHQDEHRFKWLAAGRRFQKTTILANETIKKAWLRPKTINWIVSPVYSEALIVARMINRYLPKDKILRRRHVKHDLAKLEDVEPNKYIDYRDIMLMNGSIIQYKTSIQPDRLRGEGLDHVSINECGMISDQVWYECLRPALSDRNGTTFGEGTPKGRVNWFYKEFMESQNSDESIAWQYTSLDGGFITKEEFERARYSLPALSFAQEYEAKFVDSASTVFHNLEFGEEVKYNGKGLILFEEPIENNIYYLGVDIGNLSSYTVITILNINTGEIIGFDRFNRTSYEQIEKRIENLAKYYKGQIIIDSTGVGQPVYEWLKTKGLWVTPYLFTNATKTALIQHLQVCLEQAVIKVPNLKVLRDELESFEYEMNNGNIKYKSIGFTDCVMSLALACVFYNSFMYSDFKGFVA